MLVFFQSSLFFMYVTGPVAIFAIDKLITIRRRKLELAIVSAELLPSGDYNYLFFLFKQSYSSLRDVYSSALIDVCINAQIVFYRCDKGRV